jgi:acyl-CoA synthetase (AMP-forming)/AMP-acid ligase II
MSFNITQYFFEVCDKYPDRIAIIDENKSITFKQLEKEVKNTIAYFESKGVKNGDRILVFVGMSIDLYRILLATFALGAVAVFLDEWVSLKRLNICLKMAGCKAIIAPRKLRTIGLFVKEIRKIDVFLDPKKQLLSTTYTIEETQFTSSALITFTTGSTGKPKAVDRTHTFLNEQFQVLKPLLNGEVRLTLLPVVLLLNLGLGVTSVIVKTKKFKAKNCLELVDRLKIDSIVASPYYLLELSKYVKGVLPNLKQIISGGAPIFGTEINKITSKFNTDFTIVYGSTEAEPISHFHANEVAEQKGNRGLFVGKIDPSIKLKIIPTEYDSPSITTNELNKKELKFGEIGEIIVNGITVNENYIDNPEAVKQNKIITEKEIWHRTGDSGYIDENNFLYLMGRVSQIIHHKEKIYYPFEAENALKNIPGIENGTLLKLKNKLILIISTSGEISKHNLDTFNYDELIIVKNIPVDARHKTKIDYIKLSKMIENKI